ncbi:WD40 repeat-like protein [Mycena filopes]|nr:WD40 repeat-like protein [Mycena filopes]
MRFRTLEIRWHDSKPISSCDFQPVSFKKARPPGAAVEAWGSQSYRLATAGEDNHVRVWMVYPNIRASTTASSVGDEKEKPRPARVEYLATLSRHSAAVNVVRFSPNGELIASAGDDGMVIIWAPSSSPQTSTYGSDLSPADLQHEKEYWKPRTTFRCTTMQVYDLAWSPSGEFLLAGSTDNTARVFAAVDGKALLELAEHTHFVQGVAWDPLNEYIATQSSDRAMHVYKVGAGKSTFEAHAIGRNTRFPAPSHRAHSRTPSIHRDDLASLNALSLPTPPPPPPHPTHTPTAPHAQGISVTTTGLGGGMGTPLNTPATTTGQGASSSSSSMFPPPPAGPSGAGSSSRRSSFSGSNAPSSPGYSAVSGFSRYGRSPSPMPALPAIRRSGSRYGASYDERRHPDAGTRLYGDESFSNFFRRLAFSPDGALLLTPAGTFEDPSATVPATGAGAGGAQGEAAAGSASSVYIYSRANFARPPVAQLPGHKKASVAVRFSPVLFELRPGVQGGGAPRMGTGTATGEEGDWERARDTEESMEVDLVGLASSSATTASSSAQGTSSTIAAPAPQHASFNVLASPALSPADVRRPPTPAASKPSTPHPHSGGVVASGTGTGSVFALPYRMLYAVVTMDTVAIYDTQQAGPVCLLTKLHYDEFTDLTWSPDGQCLMLSSRDGYCTLVTFDEILPTHHTQQAALQLQQIAAQHSVPISFAPSSSQGHSGGSSHSHSGSQAGGSGSGTGSRKRPHEPLTPAVSVDGDRERDVAMPPTPMATPTTGGGMAASTSGASISSLDTDATGADAEADGGPPKKKRRVALTRVGDL